MKSVHEFINEGIVYARDFNQVRQVVVLTSMFRAASRPLGRHCDAMHPHNVAHTGHTDRAMGESTLSACIYLFGHILATEHSFVHDYW